MKRILFTGGGTAGHVTPNLALMPYFLENGWDVHYIGTQDGIEHALVAAVQGVTYHEIHSGKLRRYFSMQNFTDPFRVVQGGFEATAAIKRLAPNVLFSKGGFVSVPVVYGAWLNRVPAILHESDMTPGLANRLTIPCAKTICTTFPETAEQIGKKAVYTGTPLRAELFQGDRPKGLARLGFSGNKPVLLMMGGSMGAQAVNAALRQALPALSVQFDIAHITGKGNLDDTLLGVRGYAQLEYVSVGLNDLLQAADCMLSRAGANALSEILALKKPALLVPYPKGNTSRGDQIDNAASFEKRGFSRVLLQENLVAESLTEALLTLYRDRAQLQKAMADEPLHDGTAQVIKIIEQAAL